jgi:iron complex transport system substrate-binding protein
LGTKNALALEATLDRSTRLFVDSTGREFVVPREVHAVIPSGSYAQAILTTLCPEKMTGVAHSVLDEMTDGADERMSLLSDLPEVGGLYDGGEDTADSRKMAAADPDLIIDIGEYKEGIALDLSSLQGKTGIPTVSVDASFGSLPQTYRLLGNLLNCAERAEKLAVYSEEALAEVQARSIFVKDQKTVLLAEGAAGLSVRGPYSFQTKAIEFVGAVSAANYSEDKGSIDADIDTITIWDPDVVIFTDAACYESVLHCTDEVGFLWSLLPAIRNGRFFCVPDGYYRWFGSPPLFL